MSMWINILTVILLLSIISESTWLNQFVGVLGQFPDEPIILANPIYPMYELKRSDNSDDSYYIATDHDRYDSSEEEDNKLDPDHIDYEDKDRKPASKIIEDQHIQEKFIH